MIVVESNEVRNMERAAVRAGSSLASVMEQAESHELAKRLHQAMDRLPAKEKAVLEGMYMQSEAAGDMAEGLQVSISHIYRLQKNGIRRVRGMLSRFMQNW